LCSRMPVGIVRLNGGILGEPAWKLHCSVSRGYAFPYPAEDLRWLGTIDPKRMESLRPGECEMFVLDPEARSFGILFAGVFGPGDYEIANGVIVSQSPPKGATRHFGVKAAEDPVSHHIKLSVGGNFFIRHVRKKLEPGWKEIWQNESGKAVYPGGQGSPVRDAAVEDSTVWWIEARPPFVKAPIKYGMARAGEPYQFELIVRPPAVATSGPPVKAK
jgi:hypothetical protein